MKQEFSEKKKLIAIAFKIFLTVQNIFQIACGRAFFDSVTMYTSMQFY
jgi:hypothetical protein